MPDADARLALIHDWLSGALRLTVQRIEPASSDASFRRYFRVFLAAGGTRIVMDAPPQREDVRPYLKVTRLLEGLGAHVPRVYEADVARGLLLLEDLGATHYLARLRAGCDPQPLYADALAILAHIQARGGQEACELPPYDRAPLQRELALMPEWFCGRHLGLALTQDERDLFLHTFDFLVHEALAQPRVLVHRDYHSRNLMALQERNPGILDFQDALYGPLGYDLASLLKDCYIRWPRQRVEHWVGEHARTLRRLGFGGYEAGQLLRWVDLIGVQRHLKVLGIFARLWYRDGKPGYLRDLPLTLDYVRETCGAYRPLADFARFLELRVVTELPRANERVLHDAPADSAAPRAVPDA